MDESKVPLSLFLEAYSHNLGIEWARKVVQKAISQAGIAATDEFTREEALRICEQLKMQEGVVKIIANFLITQLTPEVQELVAKIKGLEADIVRKHADDKFHIINYQD